MGLAWGWDMVRDTQMGGEGFPRLDLSFIGAPVNVNKALNEIPELSRASMFTSQQLWAEEGVRSPGSELIPADLQPSR